jgi:hypothetical protein
MSTVDIPAICIGMAGNRNTIKGLIGEIGPKKMIFGTDLSG